MAGAELTGIRWFFESNDTAARLLRTIVQGVLGVLVSYLSILATNAPEIVALLIIPVVMAVLSPIMGAIGGTLDKESTEGQHIGGSD